MAHVLTQQTTPKRLSCKHRIQEPTPESENKSTNLQPKQQQNKIHTIDTAQVVRPQHEAAEEAVWDSISSSELRKFLEMCHTKKRVSRSECTEERCAAWDGALLFGFFRCRTWCTWKKKLRRDIFCSKWHISRKTHSVTASSVASCWDSNLAKSSHTVIVQRIKTPLLLVAISIEFRSLAPVLLQLALWIQL